MSLLARIRAQGGDVLREEWRFTLKRGRLSAGAVTWLRARWTDACAEAWPLYGEWAERAAIREFDGGQQRADTERAAYAEVAGC